jgi:hypothetical protein
MVAGDRFISRKLLLVLDLHILSDILLMSAVAEAPVICQGDSFPETPLSLHFTLRWM